MLAIGTRTVASPTDTPIDTPPPPADEPQPDWCARLVVVTRAEAERSSLHSVVLAAPLFPRDIADTLLERAIDGKRRHYATWFGVFCAAAL